MRAVPGDPRSLVRHSRALSAAAGGAVARFDGVGAETGSVVACGIFEAFGSVILVPTNIDAMPSAITAMMGRAHLRTASTAELDLAWESVVTAMVDPFALAEFFAANSADS